MSTSKKITLFKNKSTGLVWEIEEGSEAFKRCKRLTNEYEEVKDKKPEDKKPEKGA